MNRPPDHDDRGAPPGGAAAGARVDLSPAGISERFRAAAAPRPGDDEPELLPTRLALAATRATGADGAGLSIMSRAFRVPLGASGEDAAALERLQFTTGQGPCWDAIRSDLPFAVDHDEIEARWPQFAAELRRATGFTSIVSVPLRLGRDTGGALDLYFTDPTASDRFDLDDASVVAAHIADRLNWADAGNRPPDLHGIQGPAWARGTAARGRLSVWVAVGMVMSETGGIPADALATLRAAAYSATRSLDDLAADVVEGRLSVAQALTG